MNEWIQRALADIAGLRVPFAVVGGHAVSMRTEPRFTRDLHLAVAVRDDTAAEGVVATLRRIGYRVDAIVEQGAVGRLATVRLSHDASPLLFDLLFATSGIEPEVVAGASELAMVPGTLVPVASVGHLIALKLLSVDDRTRPMDRADLIALARVATPADLDVAKRAVATITERGFSRGRDLAASLERLRRESAT